MYQLAPLRKRDGVIAAETNGIDPAEFLGEVERREAGPLAIKPATLTFLLNIYNRSRQFPRTRADLYLEGCRNLCEESDSRRDVGRGGQLSAEARLVVASRIAALSMFGGFGAIWTGVDRGDVPDGDLAIGRMAGGAERVRQNAITVDEDVLNDALGTGLFSGRGLRELRWSHRTYAEFLAARYIVDKNYSIPQIESLLSIPDENEGKLVPQLHETAAWLATMRNDVFQRILERDPSVLLLSDVATAEPEDREKLVATLLKLFDEEKLLDLGWGWHALYRKLSHSTLAEQLSAYITATTKGIVVRRVAIDIAEACELQSLQSELATIALDATQGIDVRVQAAYAVTRIANDETKKRLKPLAAGLREDTQDELKGCALAAIWPASYYSSAGLSVLTPPKAESFHGAYGALPDFDAQQPIS